MNPHPNITVWMAGRYGTQYGCRELPFTLIELVKSVCTNLGASTNAQVNPTSKTPD